MPYCSDCGEPVEATDRFCPECGNKLGGFEDSSTRAEREPPDSHGSSENRQPDERGRTDKVGHPEQRRGRRDDWNQPDSPDGRPPHDSRMTAPSGPGDTVGGLLGFCLKYPSRAGFGRLLGGALVLLFFWLIIPLFLAIGYFVRVTAAAAAGRPKPPAWDDFGGMLKDGFVLVIAALPLLIVVVIIQLGLEQINPLLTWPVSILVGYIFPAIWINYAIKRRWQTVYDLSNHIELMTTERYLIGYLIYVFLINGIGVFVVLILMLLSLFTIIGWIILWPLIIFYWYAIDGSLWGGVYYQLYGPADIPDPNPESPPREPRHAGPEPPDPRY